MFLEWSIDNKVTCIVTDNAKNMLIACEVLKIPKCYVLTLNLVIQDNLLANAKLFLSILNQAPWQWTFL